MPKQRNKQEMADYQRNRRIELKAALQDGQGNRNSVTPDANYPQNVTPEAVTPDIVTPANVTPKRCRVFADLPECVQVDMARINHWCRDSNIPDSFQQRVAVACEYQNQHPTRSTGLSACLLYTSPSPRD